MFNTGRLISVGFQFSPSCFEWKLVVLIFNAEKHIRLAVIHSFVFLFFLFCQVVCSRNERNYLSGLRCHCSISGSNTFIHWQCDMLYLEMPDRGGGLMDKLKLKHAVKVTPPKNPISVVFKLLFVCKQTKHWGGVVGVFWNFDRARAVFSPASFTRGTVNFVWSTQSKLSL